MKKQKIALIFTLSVLVIFSCKKKDPVPLITNVYISGTTGSGETVYWKNGEMIKCTTTDASGMIISNGDIYFPTQNGYSKNGIQFNLPHASRITSISVDGNDVYAIGYPDTSQLTRLFYWKNNSIINLPDTSLIISLWNIASINNNPVIACRGYSFIASYWQNNTLHVSDSKCFVMGMAVSESDIYLYGTTFIGVNPVYIKNGVENIINITNYDSLQYINSMSIHNNDVYFTINARPSYYGTLYEDVPLYWKNGQKVGIGLLDAYTIPASIAVDGNDVYVIATQGVLSSDSSRIESNNIIMWKNGIQETIIKNAKAQKIIISH